ncbi:MAG: hypothetical protein BRD41_00405 [Bacteroidetes bacterium QS_1_63_11]|nr:MAG: hypothetical protein BRD41_00405 [Bacteroidetes bacterium QS_1_63_11]
MEQFVEPISLFPYARSMGSFRTCLVNGYRAEPREVMPLVSYRASAEPVLRKIREVAALGTQ